ncbi:phage tail protein [Arsenophonus sp. PmNCSU2021_1]|uniref:phage tail protein n=1 Tax=Arsenophonus sp. PmNCSU2021_1 TaxID=3118989 RepID=UPI002FF072A9
MYFLDNNSGIATMPPLKETQSTTPLWFTEGDGHKGISWPGEDWFNIQQAEQLALLEAAGIRPDKGKLNQLTLAIRAIIGQEALLKTQALAEIAAAGKGAQKKARTHLGLGKLATQDGIQEATLHRKGIVQLNSSPRSADETTAATPKAVNDRVNAVVDKAPSDLDTLNKLAKAISNNPKFAENVMQILSQKLAKNENGADIPDKNQFIKNLGLTETVDCAKNALDKRTGGSVNGNLHVTQSVHIGDNDSGLRANGDGNVAFYANNAKVASWNNDRLHWLKSVEIDGTINTHSNLHISWGGRTAVYQENGDVTGPIWGGALSSWLNMQINNRGAKNTAHLATNGWWKCGDSGLIRQWGITPPLNAGQIYTVSLPCPVPHAIFSANATVKYKGIAPEGNLGTYVEIVGKSLIISADYTRTGIKAPRTWELVCY